MGKLDGLIPWLRGRRAGWSEESDRAFHDALFAAHDHDAFSPAYTGNITIRRFADLSDRFVEGCASVLDVGCGLGEITCELARRHPATRFLGVDHSEAGIAGARSNAKRLGIDNVSFETHDMERYTPSGSVDLVTMFDAFHHLLDPGAFVRRVGEHSRRFLLVEPQGDWKGSWKRDLDCDWLAADLEKIRTRIAHMTAEESPVDTSSPSAKGDPEAAGEPVENRYSIDSFEKLFAGYGLSIRGTVSGIDEYPPEPTLDTATRREFGELAYQLYRSVDERLYQSGLDLHAKHLVIHAEAGAEPENRPSPGQLPAMMDTASELRGAYDVEYLGYEGPGQGQADTTFNTRVRLRNRSFRIWSSGDDAHPDLVSYHWLDAGRRVVGEGGRSPLPRSVKPGDSVEISVRVTTPSQAGDYILAIDVVQEGKTWFGEAGSPTLDVPFRVTA